MPALLVSAAQEDLFTGASTHRTARDRAPTTLASATAKLDTDDESPFWRIVDQVARMMELSDRELALVADILEAVAGHAGRSQRGRIGR